MTDPRVLVRLDMLIGLLGLLVAMQALRLVGITPASGLVAVVLLGVAAALGTYWYRRALEEAAA